MPYINKKNRENFIDLIKQLSFLITEDGELNYVLTSLCLEYLYKDGTPRYKDYNAVIGVLESAKLEMYRRAVAPYENNKIEENGDVY